MVNVIGKIQGFYSYIKNKREEQLKAHLGFETYTKIEPLSVSQIPPIHRNLEGIMGKVVLDDSVDRMLNKHTGYM